MNGGFPNGFKTVEHGEYGERLRGIQSVQLFMVPGFEGRYVVTYSIENLSNIGGTLEILDINEFVDEFGMGSWSMKTLGNSAEYKIVERAFRQFLATFTN